MLNCHGTFYEVPRSISGGIRKMRALTTHGKRITDFASWRGLLVLTGVLDDAPASDKLVKNADGTAALWLGEIDDLWRMGEPRGTGGPWKNTAVTANTASDPYLMYGYDRKELTLTAAAATTITVELDFLGDNTWSTYQTFSLSAGQTLTHVFPAGFHAHWVRVKSSAATTATAQFTYGPADVRDRFLDWARDNNIPTGSGRDAISNLDPDGDGLPHLLEFLTNGNPAAFDPNPITFVNGEALITLRDLEASDAIFSQLEFSENLTTWAARPADVVPAAPIRRACRFHPLPHPHPSGANEALRPPPRPIGKTYQQTVELMKTILVSLLSCAAFSHAAITPVNSGFEDLSGTFPSGWNPSGTVSQTLGLGSPIAASLAAGASVHQDFAPTLADGLVTFSTSFTLRLEGPAPSRRIPPASASAATTTPET